MQITAVDYKQWKCFLTMENVSFYLIIFHQQLLPYPLQRVSIQTILQKKVIISYFEKWNQQIGMIFSPYFDVHF